MTVSKIPGHPPRGWYPDPAQRQRERYWDGAAWTQVVRRAEVVEPRPWARPRPAGDGSEGKSAETTVVDPALALPLASWGRRFGSGVADLLASWILTVGLMFAASPEFLPHLWDEYLANIAEVLRSGAVTVSQPLQSGMSTLTMVVSAVTLVYTVVFLGAWGATLGQRVFGIKVVRAPVPLAVLTHQAAAAYTPEKPGWLRSMLKGLGWTLFTTGGSVFIIAELVNALLPLWHKRRQSLTDLLASTLVVRDTPEAKPANSE